MLVEALGPLISGFMEHEHDCEEGWVVNDRPQGVIPEWEQRESGAEGMEMH